MVLVFGREQHTTVKQLSSNLKKKKCPFDLGFHFTADRNLERELRAHSLHTEVSPLLPTEL